jgi:dipeptidase D
VLQGIAIDCDYVRQQTSAVHLGQATGIAVRDSVLTSAAHYVEDAPHLPVLLDIFEHYTGQPDPQPVSLGGGTHARLVPNGVNFGPSMPGDVYTGHSEHEFMTRETFLLTLEMYTAMLVELATSKR